MARRIFKIDGFMGIDQSINQNNLQNGMSPDACNMDTYDGNLTVASGYVKHIGEQVPGTGEIYALRFFTGNGVVRVVAATADGLYAHNGTAWSQIYQYATAPSGRFDFAQGQINSTDYLIVADGVHQLIKYDGSSASLFGSAQGVSDIAVNYLALYKYRLFSAGDAAHPNRLYWSQLPGDTRSIEDWSSVEASPNVEGGHTEVGGVSGDPIVALAALPTQLVIFKKHSLYRLIGDKPGNFIVEELDATMQTTWHTSLVKSGDAVYFMTAAGMYCFNGVTAAPMDGRALIKTLSGASTQGCRSARTRDRIYFSISKDGADMLIEYDAVRRTFMLRSGFSVSDICAYDGDMYLINDARYVYRFGTGDSYDGAPISAWWQTPLTDISDKGAIKAMRELYLRGSTREEAALLVDVCVGGNTTTHRLLLPERTDDVLEVPLTGEGRTFSIKFYNEAGGHFSLEGGAELCFEQWRRVE